MSNKEKKDSILHQHSALTTFKLEEGKYYSSGVEKAVFALLYRTQQDMKTSFKENVESKLKEILPQKDVEKYIDNLYSREDLKVTNLKINEPALYKLSQEIYQFKKEEILKRTNVKEEREKLLRVLDNSSIKLLSQNQNLKLTDKDEHFLEIFNDVKSYCKDLAINKNVFLKSIDLTVLSSSIGTNVTYLKEDLRQAVDTKLRFNYINRKKLDVEVISSLIASIRFEKDEKGKNTWMTYQIPIEILNLLLMPEVYVPLSGAIIETLKGTYSIRMYSLLKDHIVKGEIELSKEEVFNFFMLPGSYEKKTHFMNKFLLPTLKEIEENAGIKTEYKFLPERAWKSIVFYPKQITKIESNVRIVEKEDIIETSSEDIEKAILKAKRNIYISKSWNKFVENKIKKLVLEEGEEYTIKILNSLYNSLKGPIKTTLVQYINGVTKNTPKVKLIPLKKNKKETAQLVLNTEEVIEDNNTITQDPLNNILYNIFLNFEDVKKEKIINAAKKLFAKKSGLKKLTPDQEKMIDKMEAIRKSFIIEVLKKEYNNE